MFGDPQPKNVAEVEYMSHDVVEQIIAEQAHGAAFGVTLGDIVFDDLSVMEPHNQAVAANWDTVVQRDRQSRSQSGCQN